MRKYINVIYFISDNMSSEQIIKVLDDIDNMLEKMINDHINEDRFFKKQIAKLKIEYDNDIFKLDRMIAYYKSLIKKSN